MPLSFSIIGVIKKAHLRGISAMAFSHDGKYLVWSDAEDNAFLFSIQDKQRLNLWNVELKDYGTKLNDNFSQKNEIYDSHIRCLTFSPDNTLVAAGDTKGEIHLWNVDAGQLVDVFKGHRKGINSIAFHPDGSKLASASDDNDVMLWSMRDLSRLKIIDAHRRRDFDKAERNYGEVMAVAFSPDGKLLASGADDMVTRLWNTVTYEELAVLGRWVDPPAGVRSLVFTHDSKQLLIGTEIGSIQVWDIADIEHEQPEKMRTLDGGLPNDPSNNIAFSPNGSALMTRVEPYGSGSQIKIWINTFSGTEEQLFMLPDDARGRIAFCSRENLFAVRGRDCIYIFKYV